MAETLILKVATRYPSPPLVVVDQLVQEIESRTESLDPELETALNEYRESRETATRGSAAPPWPTPMPHGALNGAGVQEAA